MNAEAKACYYGCIDTKNVYLLGMKTSTTLHKISVQNSFLSQAYIDPVKGTKCQLIVQLSAVGIQLALKDVRRNEIVGFEDIKIQDGVVFEQWISLWPKVVEKSKLLKNSYGNVACVLVNGRGILVPKSVFELENIKDYLAFNTGLSVEDGGAFSNELSSIDAENVFSVPKNVRESMVELCEGDLVFYHFSSALIEGIVTANKNTEDFTMYVHISEEHFEIILLNGRKLIFYNTFNYNSSEDLVYYLLFVCEQTVVNPEKIKLELLGEVLQDSAVVALVKKYVRNVSFGKRSESVQLSESFPEFPKNFYFTLLNNYYTV